VVVHITGYSQVGGASHQGEKNATGNRKSINKLLKQAISIGTWNGRTLARTGKLIKLCYEMEHYR